MATAKEIHVMPFGIEADHPRNSDLYIQVLAVRLRSAIKPIKEVIGREAGEQVMLPVPSQMIEGLPRNMPGMQLHVNPAELTYRVLDPITDEALERIQVALQRTAGYSSTSKLKKARALKGTLNEDQMKTLVREMFHLIEAEEARKAKGSIPDMDDIEDMPGEFLLNSSNRANWRQPKHEKDLDTWAEKLNSLD